MHPAYLTLVAFVLFVLVAIDRRQTLGFLPRGVPEVNPFARWVMVRFSTPQEGYLPGARIWFAGCFVLIGAAVAVGTVFVGTSPFVTWVLFVWLVLQVRTVWRNHKRGY